jgi:hypothetical protein
MIQFESAGIANGNGVRPECMFASFHGCGKPARDFPHRKSARILRLRHHSNAPVLRNGTCRPPERLVLFQPGVRIAMMHVGGVEQRDEHVNIEKCDHISLDSSIIFCTSCGVTTRPSAGKISKPCSSLPALLPEWFWIPFRANSEITLPAVFFWRAANSLAAPKMSSSISSVVRMHQMLTHQV